MRCIAAVLARNEADRYLKPVIESLQHVCDDILLLDDNSTDDTGRVAAEMGVIVHRRTGAPMWGQESSARAELWELGSELAGDGWLLIADADQILVAPQTDWQVMLRSWNVDSWAFPLFDCWDTPNQYRADGYWRGYQLARPWLFRPSATPNPVWNSRGIHTGHAPMNALGAPGIAPKSVYWKHLGWMKAEDRQEKLARYLSAKEQLTPEELAHLHSVEE